MWVVPSSSSCSSSSSSVGKQSQLLLKPTEVELGLQVGVEFDNIPLEKLVYAFKSFWSALSSLVHFVHKLVKSIFIADLPCNISTKKKTKKNSFA